MQKELQESYNHLIRAGQGWLPLENRALWALSGPDRVRYLNGQITQDVRSLALGDVVYAAVTTPKGMMEGDLFIVGAPNAFFLDASQELKESLGARLTKYLIADDATFEEIHTTHSLVHFFGKESPQISSAFIIGKNARFGLPGFDLWLPAGQTLSCEGIPIEKEIAEILRIEHGLAQWGADMNEKTLPPEAGLDRHGISYTKGCYVGQEVVARIKSVGRVNKQLVSLQPLNCEVVQVGTDLTHEGKKVGHITSSTFSPALQSPLFLGYVQRNHLEEGTLLDAGEVRVTIIPSPRKPV